MSLYEPVMPKEWRIKLASWQSEFGHKYIQKQSSKSLLVAAPGTGKTHAALYAAILMRNQGASDSLIIISDRTILRDQWIQVAAQAGLNLSATLEQYRELSHHGLSITVQFLRNTNHIDTLLELGQNSAWFGIVDEAHRDNKNINEIAARLLEINSNNRFLFISSAPPRAEETFDSQFQFDSEYIFQQTVIKQQDIKIEIVRYSPSFDVLQKLLTKHLQIDDLSWRQFEKLISELLEQDGYEVELMRGTKDGGVDVIAVKKMGEAGFFKTLWQAKKKHLKNKVGLSMIRELADTRNEFKASKGIIVTTTYLTRDALARVQRDKYILGKVDRRDLDQWIHRTLFKDIG